eukprot:TRINITY_DN15864_c0_g1_i1.p1 TRINITY_DN15864_c0_g1~~TRINITY_DN15864_c0_g1_i1.p1  ORF type:complete len:571 (+),score=112.49 TRINITY_DN15864_c0_g1_i1:156-1715(+)
MGDAANGARLSVVAKKAVGGAASAVLELCIPEGSCVGDLAGRIATHEECDRALVTLVCRGAPLAKPDVLLRSLLEDPSAALHVVYIVRKAPPAAATGATSASVAHAAAPTSAAASSAAAAGATPAAPPATSAHAAPAAPSAAPAVVPAAAPVAGGVRPGRVLLLVRHGQCCHEGESDNAKELTQHGRQQAVETARFIATMVNSGRVPFERALLHSTSRRARETAAQIPIQLPGIVTWNADLLRETDPTDNPLRAEEVFARLFIAPPAGAADTLVVVAHNNIILYLLMRAAGVPIERAAQAWQLFTLRHASITRVDVASDGTLRVISVGAAGHIPESLMTWQNIHGADMSAWKGTGGPERKKLSGRTVILVRQSDGSDAQERQRQDDAVAKHLRGLTDGVVSGSATVACAGAASQRMAAKIAKALRTSPQVMPDSITDQPEAAFLQFFCPPEGRSRDTVVLVADDRPLLYWLLRSLHLSAQEIDDKISSYCIGHASITVVNVRADRATKVVTVGDCGHLG